MDPRRLHIGITKTSLKCFHIEFDENGISQMWATVNLVTESGRVVADHTVWKSAWKNEIEVSQALEHVVMALGMELHQQAEKHIMGVHGLIEQPKEPTA